jgi:hypothetical protein
VVIDGVDLVERVRAVERPFAQAEGHSDLAGGYDGLGPAYWHDLPERYDRDDRVAVLGCVCGEAGCWPLRVRIRTESETVTWSDFEQPHRPGWSYAALGPFVFARDGYEREVAHVRTQAPVADV